MTPARRRVAVLLWALASSAWLLACGGTTNSLIESGTDGACPTAPCPSNLAWDPVTCTCDLIIDAGLPVGVDATTACMFLLCPAGSASELQDGECTCVSVDAGLPVDAGHMADSPLSDVSQEPYDPDASYLDVFSPPSDASFADASFPSDTGFLCTPYFCGEGYALNQFCQCVPCPTACPLGQTPGLSCGECVACSYACPVSFDNGPGCTCVPRGTDAGSVPLDAGDGGDGGGNVTCLLQGSYQCSAGSWCELGICPDNTTQYGCYCNADGTATCDVSCPEPPPCTIPGEAACPYGAQCVYGSCAESPSASLFVCTCESGGTAYCTTASCADGGPFIADAGNPGDSGNGGVTCLLEGYETCNAGSFCSLGTCTDGTTQYGCFCNQDGTATCDLTCPPPPPCDIPGEGTCPYGTQCFFGTCNAAGATLLTCYCGYGGDVSCSTSPCGPGGVFEGGLAD